MGVFVGGERAEGYLEKPFTSLLTPFQAGWWNAVTLSSKHSLRPTLVLPLQGRGCVCLGGQCWGGWD